MGIPAIMIGDLVGEGVLGAGFIDPKPHQIINSHQSVFNITNNYSKGGASFAGVLSLDSNTRLLNGMPGGVTFASLLLTTSALAVLINLGGNDTADTSTFILYIDNVVLTCQAYSKVFCFVGLIDVNMKSSMLHEGETNLNNYGPYLEHALRIAKNAETLRQYCNLRGYPMVDIRRLGNQIPFDQITGDIVHPSVAYYGYIFQNVAKQISGT